MADIKKMAKRAGRAVKRAVKRRYVTKTGKGLRMNQIVKDVAYLKSVLNPEKKSFQLQLTDGVTGQCAGNANGFYVRDITPVPAQGTTSITRNGNSLKLSSSYLKFQFQAQNSSAGNSIRLRVMVVKVVGEPQLSTDIVPTMFKPNPFILTSGGASADIYDYNSDRREDTFKRFIIVRSKVVTLRANMHSGQLQHVNCGMGIKYKSHHVKFTADGAQGVSDGQLFLVILSDNGNASAATTSTLQGTQSTAINTGALIQQDITHWFYDN